MVIIQLISKIPDSKTVGPNFTLDDKVSYYNYQFSPGIDQFKLIAHIFIHYAES